MNHDISSCITEESSTDVQIPLRICLKFHLSGGSFHKLFKPFICIDVPRLFVTVFSLFKMRVSFISENSVGEQLKMTRREKQVLLAGIFFDVCVLTLSRNTQKSQAECSGRKHTHPTRYIFSGANPTAHPCALSQTTKTNCGCDV
jgi:hypothetical protein